VLDEDIEEFKRVVLHVFAYVRHRAGEVDIEEAVKGLERVLSVDSVRQEDECLEQLHAGLSYFVVAVGEERADVLEEVVEVEANEVVVGGDHLFEAVQGVEFD